MGVATKRISAEAANLTYVPPDHEPVLAQELVELLAPQEGETFVDCTFGAGGHARLIAERLGPEGVAAAFDLAGALQHIDVLFERLAALSTEKEEAIA